MEITRDELAEKLSGIVADPEHAAAHVFEELFAERSREAARRALDGLPPF